MLIKIILSVLIIMEINSDTSVLNVEKLRQEANKSNPVLPTSNIYANSPFANRTLDNVLIE